MHLKSVSVLEVVGEQNSPSHDDELKIKHSHREALVAFWTDAAVPASYSSAADHPPFTVTLTTRAIMVCEPLCACVCVCFCASALQHLLHKPFGKRRQWTSPMGARPRRGAQGHGSCDSSEGMRVSAQERSMAAGQEAAAAAGKPVLGGRAVGKDCHKGWRKLKPKHFPAAAASPCWRTCALC